MSEASHDRLLIYLHYDRKGIVDEHVFYQLAKLGEICSDLLFVSNSPLTEGDRETLANMVSIIRERENLGADFGAWQEVLLDLGADALANYAEVILMNDSTYGPLFPLREMFQAMAQTRCDYWGITRGNNHLWPEHLQSYFLVFRANVIQSPAFWNFWRSLPMLSGFEAARDKGELRLTKVLDEAGFSHAAYVDLRPLEQFTPAIGPNEPEVYTQVPLLIARHRIPFIKIKAFRTEPGKQYNLGPEVYESIAEAGSDYPVALIEKHLQRARPISWSKRQPHFFNILSGAGPVVDPGFKIAVYAHLYYEDTFAQAREWLMRIPYRHDLYLSTSAEEKAKLLKGQFTAGKLANVGKVDIRVLPNRGRDVAPWLLGFADVQASYDLALKLHLKRRVPYNEIYLQQWLSFLLRCVLDSPGYIAELVGLFARRQDLGLIFNPYPAPLLLEGHHNFIGSLCDYRAYKKALQKCALPRHLETSFPLFPNNIFWYRPRALEKLFSSGIILDDFPPEPIPNEGTLAHGLERAIPYIVQSAGYAVAQAMPEDLAIETFQRYEDHILNLEHAGWRPGAPQIKIPCW